MVFASFIRKAADVEAVREVLGDDGKNIKVTGRVKSNLHYTLGITPKRYRVAGSISTA